MTVIPSYIHYVIKKKICQSLFLFSSNSNFEKFPGKKNLPVPTFYQRHCRFYCFMPGKKRLDFRAFAAKSVLLLHAQGKKA